MTRPGQTRAIVTPPGAYPSVSGGGGDQPAGVPAARTGNILGQMGLTSAQRRKMLEEIAADEEVKATQRLRALEELGRMDSREASGAADPEAVDEMPPDPMADLDELEQRRQRKAAAG